MPRAIVVVVVSHYPCLVCCARLCCVFAFHSYRRTTFLSVQRANRRSTTTATHTRTHTELRINTSVNYRVFLRRRQSPVAYSAWTWPRTTGTWRTPVPVTWTPSSGCGCAGVRELWKRRTFTMSKTTSSCRGSSSNRPSAATARTSFGECCVERKRETHRKNNILIFKISSLIR